MIADSAFASLPMLVHDLLDEKVGSVLVDAAMGVVSSSVAYRAGFKISGEASTPWRPSRPVLPLVQCDLHGPQALAEGRDAG